MRWPLRYQILFPFGGVMLAVVLGVSLLEAVLAVRRTGRQIEHQLNEVAHTLLDATFPLTDAVLKQTRGLSGAEYLLTDRRGNLKAASLAVVDASEIPSATTAGTSFRLGESVELAGHEYLHSAIAIRARGTGDAPMLLHILYPRDHLREARWQAAYPPLLVGSGLLGVVIVLAIAIAGRLSRPILDLRRELGRLVQGEFRPLPTPKRNDELADLIRSVNTLGDELDELRRAIKRSERLSVLGQLSGGLAHQLRNSVTGARMAVQLHRRHCRQIDQDSLGVALRQLSLTESHLQRFLTAGQATEPRRDRCDLRQIAADVVALVEPACNHKGVKVRFDAAGEPLELLADAEHLRQLLLNLMLNGIEAAAAGGWVAVELGRREASVVLRIVDSGPGLDDHLRERLFEPFATGKPEGIGLGLAISQKIAAAHSGTIRYVRDEHTVFEVVLPGEKDATLASDPERLELVPSHKWVGEAVVKERGLQ